MQNNSIELAVPVAEGEATSGKELQVRVLRSVAELEEVRPAWQSWCWHPNADMDLYLLLMDCKPELLRPHIMVLYRDGRPEAMLIGRVVNQRLEFKIGYKTFLKPNVRVLNIVHGGTLGDLSSEKSEVLIREIEESLRRGEADVAALNWIRTDSPLYRAARQVPGVLSRDFFPAVQSHWKMSLSGSMERDYQGGSKDYRELRRKAKKLHADYSNQVKIRCFRELVDLQRMISDVEEIAEGTYQRGLGVGFIDNAETRRHLNLEAEKGWLRAYVLYVAEKPCAFWIGNVYRGVFHGGSAGYDPRYSKYAPGKFLMTKGMETLYEGGVREIDFGLGDADYKQGFGNGKWDEVLIYIFAPTLRGFWLNALRTPMVVIDQLAKKALEKTSLLPKIKRIWRDRVRQN